MKLVVLGANGETVVRRRHVLAHNVRWIGFRDR
jgi:hypothetical protein